MKLFLYSIFIVSLEISCTALKPYETQYVRDPEMHMGQDEGKIFDDYIHSIREGASPAGTIKSSGGCGCN